MEVIQNQEAILYVNKHEKEIINQFANPSLYPPSDNPFTIFMAGSPGAGKTEYSKTFIKEFTSQENSPNVVRIDADRVRDLLHILPQFTKYSSCELQSACNKTVSRLFDHVQKHKQNAVVDGTFAHYEISKKDVERALNRGRSVGIKYLYQEPVLAWNFTKEREALEGRNITKDVFIDDFFAAKENVDKVKVEFGSKIELYLIIKDYRNKEKKSFFNIDKVDHYLKIRYTKEELREMLI